jgi:hypothetical protein
VVFSCSIALLKLYKSTKSIYCWVEAVQRRILRMLPPKVPS